MANTTLRKDLLHCSAGLTIGASGVTLDLNGHTIDGKTVGDGVNVDGFDDVTIKNGTIKQFLRAVRINDADNARVVGVRTVSNQRGVYLCGTNSDIVRNIFTASDIGVDLPCAESDGNLIKGNKITDHYAVAGSPGSKGIRLMNAVNNTVIRNRISGMTDNGISLNLASAGNKIIENVVTGNDNNGLYTDAPVTATQFTSNKFNLNGFYGMAVNSSDPATTITGNVANYNTETGIYAATGVTDGGGNRAKGNLVAQCTGVSCP